MLGRQGNALRSEMLQYGPMVHLAHIAVRSGAEHGGATGDLGGQLPAMPPHGDQLLLDLDYGGIGEFAGRGDIGSAIRENDVGKTPHLGGAVPDGHPHAGTQQCFQLVGAFAVADPPPSSLSPRLPRTPRQTYIELLPMARPGFATAIQRRLGRGRISPNSSLPCAEASWLRLGEVVCDGCNGGESQPPHAAFFFPRRRLRVSFQRRWSHQYWPGARRMKSSIRLVYH